MQQPVAWPASVSTKALASQKVLDLLRPLDTQFIRKNSNNSGNNMKSQTKNKKNQKYKFVVLLMPTLNKFISCQFLLILLEGANNEQSSQNNQSTCGTSP